MSILCTLFGLWCAQPATLHAKMYVVDPAECVYGAEPYEDVDAVSTDTMVRQKIRIYSCKDKP
jgi:hypothetical protein